MKKIKKATISRWPGRDHFIVIFDRNEDYSKRFLNIEDAINFALTKVEKDNIVFHLDVKIPRIHEGD
jgi:hypothetical protein